MAEPTIDPLVQAAEDLDALIKALAEIGGVSVELLVGRPLKEALCGWRRLALDDDFHKVMRKEVVRILDENLGRAPIPLEFDAITDETVGVIDLGTFEPFAGPFAKVPATTTSCGIEGDVSFLEKAKYTAKRLVTAAGEHALLFQAAGNSLVLKRPLLAVFSESKSLVKPPGNSFVDFPTDFCAMIWRKNVYVFQEKKFSALTKFDEVVKTAADAAFAKLKASEEIGFDNIQAVEAALAKSSEFRRKFAAADKGGALARLSADRIESMTAEYDVAIKHKRQGKRLILSPNLSDRKGRQDLIDLLGDRLAKSLTTDLGYRIQKGYPLQKSQKK